MSVVTDVVFVTEYHSEAEQFQQLVRTLYTHYSDPPYIPHPVEGSGPKVSGAIVFHHGFNYMDQELREALREHPWRPGTVLWMQGEEEIGPEIHVGPECISRPGYGV